MIDNMTIKSYWDRITKHLTAEFFEDKYYVKKEGNNDYTFKLYNPENMTSSYLKIVCAHINTIGQNVHFKIKNSLRKWWFGDKSIKDFSKHDYEAAINLLFPLVFILGTIQSGVLKLGAKYVFANIFMWVVVLFAYWIGFQLWWNRRKNVERVVSSEFFAIACFCDILQTFGEWFGTMIGILGAGVGLITLIFFGNEAGQMFNLIGLNFMQQYGAFTVIIGPIIGFFIIVAFRIIAEIFRLFSSLVNNTKDIAENIKNNM